MRQRITTIPFNTKNTMDIPIGAKRHTKIRGKFLSVIYLYFGEFLQICFYKFFFGKSFFRLIVFGESFSFHKNISAKIFFTIFSRIPFVFDVCEIKYFAKFFIWKFAYCEFFCFAILVYGKKIVNFFCVFFSDEREYQIWKCLFWKKVKLKVVYSLLGK